ncbi:DegQ family serine endoprotease [Salinisphaera hydrothermalis]|uniref:2-alkenal reductase n=1 Tax=Salinisphaera hydrothermalis (strain C41B8) TaxID=1304275 RepID=A0A084IKY1_SALHC|nr:DegQ family serine endoprotease [Salinisphaera hydrothermalis]KEZ77365.1 2-alkenal reductase [Salinisphaera hydrothermalis C41B8]
MTQLASLRYRAFFILILALLGTSAQASIPSGMLSGDDPSLAPMLDKTLPAVVNVVVTGKAQQAPNNPLFNDPFFRQFFNAPQQQQMEHPTAIGSGVIVNADKGYIVTNNHVVRNAQKIEVRLRDNRQFKAKIVGTDPATDLAVIQIKAKNLTQINLANSDKLRVGDFVVAVGNPFGLRQTVTSGIVSGLGRHIGNPEGEQGSRYQNFIQTDASINPGNSGGALLNLKGQLVGINSEILSQSGGNIGIGFAIPSNLVKTVYQQLIKYGKVKRGMLGVVGQNLTPDLAKAFGLNIDQGVVIAQVMPDSPAAKAGIKQRDVITAVNGKEIDNFSDLQNAIGLRSPGDKVTIDLLRDGKKEQVHATLAKASEMTGAGDASTGGSLNKNLAGAQFGPLTDNNPLSGDVQGVVVTNVQPGSPAAQAGLQPGDVITSVNRQQISSVSQLHKLAGPDTKQLLLHVRRGQGALFLLIQ